ncbi:MAG: hypothetical protein K8S97_16835 [Anaerolineae bacterium]|nr:hypothetical protein [Anaerolineae bacterium]
MTQQPACIEEYAAAGAYSRSIVSLTVPSFDALPREIVLPSPHFVCLLCSDARGVPDRMIIDAATTLLDRGLVYLCAWGPDCERVRNLFETAALVWNSRVAVLTVHFYDDLDDVFGYFLDVAYPAMAYTASCQTGLVLSIGTLDWTEYIRQRLTIACSTVTKA